MKRDNTAEKVNRLLDFISDNEDASIDEVKNELKAEGVNIDKFLENVNRTVRRSIQSRIKDEIASCEIKAEINFAALADEIREWTMEKCVNFMRKIADGEACTPSQQKIAMAYRNRKDAGNQTLEELRSCITDILSLDGKDEK